MTATEFYGNEMRRHVEAARPGIDTSTEFAADQSHAYVREALEAVGISVTDDTCKAAIVGAIWLDCFIHTQLSPTVRHALAALLDGSVTIAAGVFTNAAEREKNKRGPLVDSDFVEQTKTIRMWVRGKAVNAVDLFEELEHWADHYFSATAEVDE